MTVSGLAVPLSLAQVRAGIAIYEYVPWFKTVDGVLADLKSEKPGFDARSTLLKAVAINTLYAAGVRDVHRATDHVVAVMSRAVAGDDVQLVEGLAAIPRQSGDPGYCPVFASKFAHFFIRDTVPILDSFSERRIAHHLGLTWTDQNRVGRYTTFVKNTEKLFALAGVTETPRNLDKYLWVAGEYAAFKAGNTGLNPDLTEVFTQRPQSLVGHLDALL